MRLAGFAAALLMCSAASLCAQVTNATGSFSSIDSCGGQSAFVGSTAIIEESSANCAVVPSSISYASGTYTLIASLPGAQQYDEIYFVGGSPSPSCLGTITTFRLGLPSGTTFPFSALGCTPTGTPALNGATVYVNYVKGSSSTTQRYELKLLQQSSGSWSSAPTTTILTTAAFRAANFGTGGVSCSAGNPAGYFDGSNYYIAFIAQDPASSNCTTGSMSGVSPSKGQYYDLWGCDLGSSLPGTMSSTTCGPLATVSSNGDSFLDPHFYTSTQIYVSERNNANAKMYASSYPYNIWAIDAVSVTWSGPPTAGTNSWIFLTSSQWDTGRARATNHCEEYYKLTSLFTPPGASVPRAFFQMNYIDGASSTSPFNGYGSGTCDSFGAGGATDQFLFSGLFYGDLTTGTSLGSNLYLGTDLTQLYPYPTASPTAGMCLTPSGNIHCYGEFPWMFHDGTKMLFLGNTVTQTGIVDACASVTNCQANFTAEIVQAQVSADYTQSTLPMQIGGFGVFSTMMDLGTLNCGQALSASGTSTGACGLQDPSGGPFYGNCGHLDIDEASGYLTCGNLTNIFYTGPIYVRRTMVVPLAPAFFNAPILTQGPFRMSGGVELRSQ